MDVNAGIIDQRVSAFVSRQREALLERLGPQAANDEHKIRSAAFALLCLQALLQIDDDTTLDCLTDGGNDVGVDGLHIGDVVDGEFTVTIANAKYSKSLDGTAGFPANAITRVIATIQRMFDPDAKLEVHTRLAELVTEVRSLILDGNIPEVRAVLCNNGKTWESNGQAEIDASKLKSKRVSFHHINHDNLVDFLQKKKVVDALLHLSGKAIVDDFDYRRVLVGRLPVTEVKQLFDTHGDALLDRNIRRYLGLKDNRVNYGIHTTLLDGKQRPNFYFFNNGITAICSQFSHNALQEGNWDVQITGLQIVNGGQTSKTIQRTITADNSTDFSKTFVLFRLYELASAQDDVLVNRITFATNSQNPVDLTDLRSNDATQERLATALKDLGFDYKRKRDDQVVSSPEIITSAVAAEAVMAAWRRKPNAAKFRRSKLFSDYYSDVFRRTFKQATSCSQSWPSDWSKTSGNGLHKNVRITSLTHRTSCQWLFSTCCSASSNCSAQRSIIRTCLKSERRSSQTSPNCMLRPSNASAQLSGRWGLRRIRPCPELRLSSAAATFWSRCRPP